MTAKKENNKSFTLTVVLMVSLILALLLPTTIAWFTDSATGTANSALKFGSVAVETGTIKFNDEIEIVNIVPGDVIPFEFEVYNTGNVDEYVMVSYDIKITYDGDDITTLLTDEGHLSIDNLSSTETAVENTTKVLLLESSQVEGSGITFSGDINISTTLPNEVDGYTFNGSLNNVKIVLNAKVAAIQKDNYTDIANLETTLQNIIDSKIVYSLGGETNSELYVNGNKATTVASFDASTAGDKSLMAFIVDDAVVSNVSANENAGEVKLMSAITPLATTGVVEGRKLIVVGTGVVKEDMTNTMLSEEQQKSIEEVIICEGITEIETSAFFGLENCTKVTFPEGLTTVGYQSFYSSNATFNIPSTLTNIEIGETFNGYFISNVASGNTRFVKKFGNISELVDGKKYLIQAYVNNHTIPNDIYGIYKGALSGGDYIYIPESVTYIQQDALDGFNAIYFMYDEAWGFDGEVDDYCPVDLSFEYGYHGDSNFYYKAKLNWFPGDHSVDPGRITYNDKTVYLGYWYDVNGVPTIVDIEYVDITFVNEDLELETRGIENDIWFDVVGDKLSFLNVAKMLYPNEQIQLKYSFGGVDYTAMLTFAEFATGNLVVGFDGAKLIASSNYDEVAEQITESQVGTIKLINMQSTQFNGAICNKINLYYTKSSTEISIKALTGAIQKYPNESVTLTFTINSVRHGVTTTINKIASGNFAIGFDGTKLITSTNYDELVDDLTYSQIGTIQLVGLEEIECLTLRSSNIIANITRNSETELAVSVMNFAISDYPSEQMTLSVDGGYSIKITISQISAGNLIIGFTGEELISSTNIDDIMSQMPQPPEDVYTGTIRIYFDESIDVDNTWLNQSFADEFDWVNDDPYTEMYFEYECVEVSRAEEVGFIFQDWSNADEEACEAPEYYTDNVTIGDLVDSTYYLTFDGEDLILYTD